MPEGAVLADKYRIDALLAEGGMGLVYLGWHLILDQAVAIKLVRPELAHRPDAADRFLNEARAVARLRGPNVARVLDSGRAANGQLYMVFEYLQGADLRTVLDTEGPLGIERAVDYVLQASEAMAEAHVAGIVHRDLKPENLFLTTLPDGSDQIKVLDFGIAKRLDDHQRAHQTVQGQNLGSPHYMAPEQMSTPSQVDTRADLWSLGIVLYELLSGDVPFDGETVPTICAQVLGREPVPVRGVRPDAPAGLEAVIQRCLEKKAERRYQTVAELAEALAPFGSPSAVASMRRIRRLFGLESASNPEILVDVDVDLTGFDHDEHTPTPRTFSITHDHARPRRRAVWPVGIALAAGVVLAVGLPQGALVSDAMAHARARFSAAIGGVSAATPSVEAKVLPVVRAARPAVVPTTTATAALPTPSTDDLENDVATDAAAAVSPVIDLDAAPAATETAPVQRAAPPRQAPRQQWRPRYRAPARSAPTPAAPTPALDAPDGTKSRDVDQLIPPYDSKAPARSGELSFKSAPSTDSLMVGVGRKLDNQASSRVDP